MISTLYPLHRAIAVVQHVKKEKIRMFTGIIEATGEIQALNLNANGARVTVKSHALDFGDAKLGDSIATNGICLTVVEYTESSFSADVSNETLSRTCFGRYKRGQRVNLEKAMLPTTRFGGHIVSGHVDGIGVVSKVQASGNSVEYWIDAPDDLAKYLAEKGSITVDGASLTVNSVKGSSFRLTIVPHTTAETCINEYQVGTKVNLEIDVIARYVERMLFCQSQAHEDSARKSNVTESLLLKSGFIK